MCPNAEPCLRFFALDLKVHCLRFLSTPHLQKRVSDSRQSEEVVLWSKVTKVAHFSISAPAIMLLLCRCPRQK